MARPGAEGVEVAALGAEAGDEQGHIGQAGESVRRGVGEAENETGLSAGGGHVGDDFEDAAITVGEGLQFDVGGAGVGGNGEQIQPLAFVGEEGLQGVATHEGIEGDGIDTELVEAGAGVVGLGLADIATFDIEDDGNVRWDEGEHLLEQLQTAPAEGFEVGGVGFESGGVRGGVIDDTADPVAGGVAGVGRAHVETDAEVGAGGGDAGGEFVAIGHADGRNILFARNGMNASRKRPPPSRVDAGAAPRKMVAMTKDSNAAPLVGIIMGSSSDWPTMKLAAEVLEQFGVPFEKRVVSAHRTPALLYEYACGAEGRGLRCLIAGAGGAAHLPGMAASMTVLPVLGVPVQSKALNGVDSLYSIVQMPGGVPVATFAIGSAGAMNAGLFAIQLLAAAGDERLARELHAFRARQQEKVMQSQAELE